jgi:hypothetical protein
MPTKEEFERRLAPHGVMPETSEPQPDEAAATETEPEKPPEPQVKTVADVIRLAVGTDARVVVALLKKVGALEERPGENGTELVYKLHKPLRKAVGPDLHPGLGKLAFATEIRGWHRRRMLRIREEHENAVLMTWIEAFTGKDSTLTDRLHPIDLEACMAIAFSIEMESRSGNA